MKRSLALVALLVLGFSTTSFAALSRTTYSDRGTTSAIAPDRVGQWDMGLFAGYAFNSDSDDTGYFGANIAYGVTPWIALGMEAGWQESTLSSDEDNDLGLVPILADIIVRLPNVHSTIVPYGVLGLGVIGAYVTDDNGVAPNNDGQDVSDTSFGWKIGLGADWFMNENWILNFEWSYYSSSADLGRFDIDPDFWTLGVGVKYVY